MTTLDAAVADFLAQGRIAVAGVSRAGGQPANAVFERLRETGHQVFAVNPAASEVGGDPCYPDLRSVPGGVDAVMIVTPAAAAEGIVRECAELGISRVWMHRSFGEGSVSEAAVRLGRESGLTVIDGGCPLMFCGAVDFGHRCMRWWLRRTGGLPREV